MRTYQLALAAVFSGVLASAAMAQTTSTERIDQRQANQQQRIDAGIKSGDLNKAEARRLERGQERVQKMEDKAMADGKVTKGEARKIEAAQDVQSGRIARQRHDGQKAKQ